MTRFLTSPNIWRFAALYAAFWAVAAFQDYRPLNVYLQFMTIAAAAVVLWTYREMAWASLIEREPGQDDHLILGIACAWLGVLLRSLSIIIWRMGWFGNDVTDPMELDILNSFNFMIVLGGVLHATAPGTVKGRVPPINWWNLTMAALLGTVLWALFVLGPFRYVG